MGDWFPLSVSNSSGSLSHLSPNLSYPPTQFMGPTPHTPQPPAHLLAVCTFLYVLIFLLGLIGNGAVILVVLQCRSMRTSINLLFLNLCIADLFALVITGPTVMLDMYAREVWYLGPIMCKMIPFLENVVGNASAVTILAISVERYRVAFRASTTSMTTCNVCRSFLAIWMLSCLGALPMLFIVKYEQRRFLDGSPVDFCNNPIDQPWKKGYIVMITFMFFILPLLMIFFLYTKVYMKLMLLFRSEQEKQITYPREIVRLKRQMTQIIITVVLVFFICHTPFRAFVMWSIFTTRDILENLDTNSYLTMVYNLRLLLYSNHAINPFVYNFVSRKFRRALLWLCCERKRRNARLEDWKGLVNNRQPIRMESIRQHRLSTAGRLFDLDNNLREKEREEQEALDRHSHFQRNDFLVLYENLLLE